MNTAGGLFVAISRIVAYNVFVTRVDNFNYMMDEASYEVVQLAAVGDRVTERNRGRERCSRRSDASASAST